jgi:hypothetical protein
VRQILLDASARIETVAPLHRLLAQSDAKALPAAEFLRDMCSDGFDCRRPGQCDRRMLLRTDDSTESGARASYNGAVLPFR